MYAAFVCITIFCLEKVRFGAGVTGGGEDGEDESSAAGSRKKLVRGMSVQGLQRKATMERSLSSQKRKSFRAPSKNHDDGVDMSEAAIPFEPVTLVWKNLWYTVEIDGKDGTKEPLDLLKGVSGFTKPGQMTALMGSSGAGKTTLMDVIAGRKTSGTIKGDIIVNGNPQVLDTFSRISGYVEQMDIHSPMTTVAEAVYFSARLRLPETVAMAVKDKFVEQILDTLELNFIKNKIVGTLSDGGLSVEQRKRLTIAVELGANPSVLFLDEPTSGLDARAAIIVLSNVRKIAYSGRSVMCTIHQPSIFLFQMFDQLLLLKRGGETVFFGDIGENADHLISYFSAYPGTPTISAGANPATWMLDVIGAGMGASEIDYAALYRQSSLFSISEDEVDRLLISSKKAPLAFSGEYATGPWTQFRELMKKYQNVYYRTPSYNFTRVVVGVLVAGVFGSVYYEGDIAGVSDVQSRIAMIFVTTIFNGIINMSSVLPVMEAERSAFYRERAAKTFGVEAYAAATGIVEIPYIVTTCMCFLVVFYFSCSLEFEFVAFAQYALTYIIVIGMFTFFGQFLSAALPNTETAQVIGSASVSLFSMFGGLFITYGNMPTYWKFAYWVTPVHYALEALTAPQFGRDETCAVPALFDIGPVKCRATGVQNRGGGGYKMKRGVQLIFLVDLSKMAFTPSFVSSFIPYFMPSLLPLTVADFYEAVAPDFDPAFFGFDLLVCT
jgi:ABC-type multidrug transport system ATPase subunit/ABC-type multidrug transport system permease subunit